MLCGYAPPAPRATFPLVIHTSLYGDRAGHPVLIGMIPLFSGTFISVIAFSGSRLSQRCRWSCQQRGLGLLRLVGLNVLCNLAERGLSERELELGEPGEQHQPRGRLPCALCPRTYRPELCLYEAPENLWRLNFLLTPGSFSGFWPDKDVNHCLCVFVCLESSPLPSVEGGTYFLSEKHKL